MTGRHPRSRAAPARPDSLHPASGAPPVTPPPGDLGALFAAIQPSPPNVSRETDRALHAYVALLTRWQATINLVAPSTLACLWQRHILDSAQLWPLLPSGLSPDRPLIDLGSGAGLPGLVLALLGPGRSGGFHPESHPPDAATARPWVHLVERDQRKAAFLREAVRVTGAAARVHAQDLATLTLPPAGAITARALAPLSALIGLARPLLAPEGVLIAPKGKEAQEELTAARATWNMHVTCVGSLTDPRATVLVIKAPEPSGSGTKTGYHSESKVPPGPQPPPA